MKWREFCDRMDIGRTEEDEIEYVESLTETGTSREIVNLLWTVRSQTAFCLLIKKALQQGVHFSLSEVKKLKDRMDRSMDMPLVRQLQDLSSPQGVLRLLRCLSDEHAIGLLAQRALDQGMRFPAADIADIIYYLPDSMQGRMLRANSTPYTKKDLEELSLLNEEFLIPIKADLYHREHPHITYTPVYDPDSEEFMSPDEYRRKLAEEEVQAQAITNFYAAACEPSPAPRKKKVKRKRKGLLAKTAELVGMYFIGGIIKDALGGKKRRNRWF